MNRDYVITAEDIERGYFEIIVNNKVKRYNVISVPSEVIRAQKEKTNV